MVSLANSGEDKNTLVYFTSDHGGHIDIGVNGGWNAPFRQVNFILIHDVDHHWSKSNVQLNCFLPNRGGKFMAAQEGGVRVPGIVRWPGKVSREHCSGKVMLVAGSAWLWAWPAQLPDGPDAHPGGGGQGQAAQGPLAGWGQHGRWAWKKAGRDYMASGIGKGSLPMVFLKRC